MSINPIGPATPILPPQTIAGVSEALPADGSFGALITNALDGVEAAQNAAHASAESFMRGDTQEIHKVALDQQRAAIAFDMFLQVRNKVVSAYQEIMKMQM